MGLFLAGLKDLLLVVHVGKRVLVVSAALRFASAFVCVAGRLAGWLGLPAGLLVGVPGLSAVWMHPPLLLPILL